MPEETDRLVAWMVAEVHSELARALFDRAGLPNSTLRRVVERARLAPDDEQRALAVLVACTRGAELEELLDDYALWGL